MVIVLVVDLAAGVSIVHDLETKMIFVPISNARKLLLPKPSQDAQSSLDSPPHIKRKSTLLMDLTSQKRMMYQVTG